jgi:hypothetical protein
MSLGLVSYVNGDEYEETVDATMDKQMIGSLMNSMTDICFLVNILSQYMVVMRHIHLIAEKHVMSYLKGTIDYGLRYISDHEISLQGYTDSNWVDSIADQKSTS